MSGWLDPLTLISAALLAPMAAVAFINLLAAPRLHRHASARRGPAVSVLVPARDEAMNLRRLLPALLASRYEPLEILVLDDDSDDGTAAVVRRFAASDPRLRLVNGLPEPGGWTGKNWACHQLGQQATGDILVFCDADVVPGPEAVGRTVTALAGADVLTAFPRHETGDWLERAVIPVVAQLPVAALLPLPLVRWTRARSLAVGNGQWLAWTRDAYRAAGGHQGVRANVLEDVALARRAKAAGARLLPLLALHDLTVRMYRTRAELWQGFGKNLYLLAGGNPLSLGVAAVVFGLTMLVPLLLPLVPGAGALQLLPLALLVAIRTLAAVTFGDPPDSVALHPVGAAATLALGAVSWRRHSTGKVTWKRRTILTRDAP